MHTEKCAHTHIYIYSHTCTSTALTEVLRNKCFENKDIYFFIAASDKVSMPDTLGHSVGLERFELLAKLAGNEVYFYDKKMVHLKLKDCS